MGDPLYGKGNKNREGMKLTAVRLRFRCPEDGREVLLDLEDLLGADSAPLGGWDAGRPGSRDKGK
jgi:tRNA pseudouridine32 synthase/23S rRNA pseudouridine746 synthase